MIEDHKPSIIFLENGVFRAKVEGPTLVVGKCQGGASKGLNRLIGGGEGNEGRRLGRAEWENNEILFIAG